MKIIKHFKALALICSSALMLSACQSTANDQQSQEKSKPMAPVSSKPTIETIHDVEILPAAIRFTVVSNGCTKNKSFVIDTQVEGENTIKVTLLRLSPDYCRAMPKLIQITKPIIQLAGNDKMKVIIANPFASHKPGRQAATSEVK